MIRKRHVSCYWQEDKIKLYRKNRKPHPKVGVVLNNSRNRHGNNGTGLWAAGQMEGGNNLIAE